MRYHDHMRSVVNAPDKVPKITRQLLGRVFQYGRPYQWLILAMLVLTLASNRADSADPHRVGRHDR